MTRAELIASLRLRAVVGGLHISADGARQIADMLEVDADLRALLAEWHAACDAEGVPHDPEALIRHHRGSQAIITAGECYLERHELRALLAEIMEQCPWTFPPDLWERLQRAVKP